MPLDCGEKFPAPLTPAECRLGDEVTPGVFRRLLASEAWRGAAARPEIGFYLANLVAASLAEKPAGSVPGDPRRVAEMAMCRWPRWELVGHWVLDRWVLCSDGRYYHPIVAAAVAGREERPARRTGPRLSAAVLAGVA